MLTGNELEEMRPEAGDGPAPGNDALESPAPTATRQRPDRWTPLHFIGLIGSGFGSRGRDGRFTSD